MISNVFVKRFVSVQRKSKKSNNTSNSHQNQESLFSRRVGVEGGHETSTLDSRRAKIPDNVEPRQYGGICIEELVGKFEALALDYGGKYNPSYWNGSGEIVLNVARFDVVSDVMSKVSVLSFRYEFTCVFRVVMFCDDSHGFRYALKIKLPGILHSSAFQA